MAEYDTLRITGDISLKPIPADERVDGNSWMFLIMGPTGAGKSSFIEALAGSTQALEISKDQLSGYTQCVTAYHLENVFRGLNQHPIYLIDTPGFSDTKISEKEIIDMVRNWMKGNDVSYCDAILFLTPTTEPRLAGSKGRTITMLKAFLKPSRSLNAIIFATTMWDQLHNARTNQRAESNYTQLSSEILKEFMDAGGQISRFRNTRDSALEILDLVVANSVTMFSQGAHGESLHLYQDLHGRKEGALQQKKAIEVDLATQEAQTNPALESILTNNRRDNEETLTKFVGQLAAFGQLPIGYERVAQDLRKRIALEFGPVDDEQGELFRSWAHEAEIPEGGFKYEKPIYPAFRLLDNNTLTYPVVQPLHDTTRGLALKGLIRRLINVAKRGENKWFKGRA